MGLQVLGLASEGLGLEFRVLGIYGFRDGAFWRFRVEGSDSRYLNSR